MAYTLVSMGEDLENGGNIFIIDYNKEHLRLDDKEFQSFIAWHDGIGCITSSCSCQQESQCNAIERCIDRL